MFHRQCPTPVVFDRRNHWQYSLEKLERVEHPAFNVELGNCSCFDWCCSLSETSNNDQDTLRSHIWHCCFGIQYVLLTDIASSIRSLPERSSPNNVSRHACSADPEFNAGTLLTDGVTAFLSLTISSYEVFFSRLSTVARIGGRAASFRSIDPVKRVGRSSIVVWTPSAGERASSLIDASTRGVFQSDDGVVTRCSERWLSLSILPSRRFSSLISLVNARYWASRRAETPRERIVWSVTVVVLRRVWIDQFVLFRRQRTTSPVFSQIHTGRVNGSVGNDTCWPVTVEMIGIFCLCKWRCSKIAFIRWQSDEFQRTRMKASQSIQQFHSNSISIRRIFSFVSIIDHLSRWIEHGKIFVQFIVNYLCSNWSRLSTVLNLWRNCCLTLKRHSIRRRNVYWFHLDSGRSMWRGEDTQFSLDEGRGRVLIRPGRVLERRSTAKWIQPPTNGIRRRITRFSTSQSHGQCRAWWVVICTKAILAMSRDISLNCTEHVDGIFVGCFEKHSICLSNVRRSTTQSDEHSTSREGI